MGKIKISDRIKYFFDNIMSKGTISLIGWVGVISIILTLLISLISWFIGIAYGDNFINQFWISLMFSITTFDPTEGQSWSVKIALFLTLLVGLFATSILIGILTAGIEEKIQSLRKGRSKVIESNHTIILGWSNYIFPIISEIISANSNQKKTCIVILADKDKVEMEDEINDKIDDFKNTRVVCRTGNPIEISDLELTSPNTSKSIIILKSTEENSDFYTNKILLAITRNPNRKKENYHIVSEIHDEGNMEIAKIIGKNEIELIYTEQFISRIIAQTCLQAGLSSVYSELLEFSGNEFYITDYPELYGKKFKEALFAFKNSCVVGIYENQKTILLNPSFDRIINKNDQLILIAEDDVKQIPDFNYTNKIKNKLISKSGKHKKNSDDILILGWNKNTNDIIKELSSYLVKGSKITIVADLDKNELKNNIKFKRKDIQINYLSGDITQRKFLKSLPLKNTTHIIVIPYIDSMDTQDADALTLTALLHLRELSVQNNYKYSIVSEIIDIRNRKLIEVEKIDDFVVSDKLISLILAQISENKALSEIFSILLNPGGVEIYIKPAIGYVLPDTNVNFYTVIEAGKKKKEIAIGYRINSQANVLEKRNGIYLNPDKNDMITFNKDDAVIVIAEC